MQNEIKHFGIEGMKWGVRRYQNEDGTLTPAGKARYNANYSEQQRTRDKKLYGRGAVERINKRMNKGESIQSARHDEVVRRDRIESGKAIAKNVAKGALVIGGAAAVATYLKRRGFGNSAADEVITEQVINIGRQIINAMFK